MIHPIGYIPIAPMGYGLWALFFWVRGDIVVRVIAFIDGFNLYHAIHDLGQNHLKWLDLSKLVRHFAPSPDYKIKDIFYFSAFATWRKKAVQRHRKYVKALNAKNVTTVMAKFKTKDRSCFKCGHKWIDHEEKETDVNIALYMLREGYRDSCDRFILISADSDLSPAVRMLNKEFPDKNVRIIFPFARGYSWDLVHAVGGKKNIRQLKRIHLERSLIEKEVRSDTGELIIRPTEYDPPTNNMRE